MADDRLILIYESLDESEIFSFENEFVCKFDKFLSQFAILHVDSYSEKHLFQYGVQAIDQCEEVLVLILNDKAKSLSGLTGILSALLKKEKARCLAINENPYLIKIPGFKQVKDRGELLKKAYSWISKSSASS